VSDPTPATAPDATDPEADGAGTDTAPSRAPLDATLEGAADLEADAQEAGEDAVVADVADDAVAAEPLGTFVVLEVVNVAFELPSPNPMLHLLERDSPFRGLDFPIGLPEAQSIAYALEREQAPRPTTHDLAISLLAVAGCEVVAVRLIGEKGGTILAELDLMAPSGHEVLDCRPSDGIAIALRLAVPAPILCEASLLDR
jgi:bifunctional DNase/RNase